MGPKYLPELGYTRLYEATWVAGRELGAFAQIRQVRDLATYALRDVATLDAAAVRARFAPARWQAFKRDLRVFGPRINPWDALLLIGAAGLARGAGVVAGLGFGYAVLARVFPVLFLIPLVVSWAQGRLTGAREAALARCLATAAVLVTAVTLVLVAMPATRTLSEDFVAKIERHNRGVYSNHVGLG